MLPEVIISDATESLLLEADFSRIGCTRRVRGTPVKIEERRVSPTADSPIHHLVPIGFVLREGRVVIQRLPREEDWLHRAEQEPRRRPSFGLGSCRVSAPMHEP